MLQPHAHPRWHTAHGRAFAVSLALNVAVVVVEVVYGISANSMALIADAAHNLGDVLALSLAWVGIALGQRKPSRRRTYGLRRISILSAFANAVLLLVATGGVGWESIQRLGHSGAVDGVTMIIVGTITSVINAASALLFLRGRKRDLNLRAAFVHLAGDAALALGVVGAGAVIAFTHLYVLDPVVSLVLGALILASTWSLLRHSLGLLLDVVPEAIDPERVRGYLSTLPGVCEVHDLHIWALSTTETALTAHLVMFANTSGQELVGHACKVLHDEFAIEHSTLQIEPAGAATPCRLAPDDRV